MKDRGNRFGRAKGNRSKREKSQRYWAGLETLERRLLLSATLDPLFGSDGVVTADFAGSTLDQAVEVLAQSDGKIILAGQSRDQQLTGFSLARYLPDGSLDASFGQEGRVVQFFADGHYIASEAVLDVSGRVVIAGYRNAFGTSSEARLALMRFMPDGTLDTSFGDQGRVIESLGHRWARGTGLALDEAGNVLIAGYGQTIDTGAYQAFVARYDVNGQLDMDFGGGDGWALLGPGLAYDVAVGVNGVYAAGAQGSAMAVWRLDTAGVLDATFNDDGVATLTTAASEIGFREIVVDTQGRAVLSGDSGHSSSVIWIARFTTSGLLDTSFSGDGLFELPGWNSAGLTLDGEGRILAGAYNRRVTVARLLDDGTLDSGFGGDGIVDDVVTTGRSIALAGEAVLIGGYVNNDFLLVRYHDDGTLDTGLDGDGWTITDFMGSRIEEAITTVVLPDGRLLVAGTHHSPATSYDFVVTRYHADGTLDTSFGGGSGSVMIHHKGQDVLGDIAIDSQGRIVLAGTTNANIGGSSIDPHDMLVVRLLPGGELDTSFDGDGRRELDIPELPGRGESLLIDAQDRILVGGSLSISFGLVRFLPTGAIDTSFSSNGWHTFSVSGGGIHKKIEDIVIDDAGRIVAAGSDQTYSTFTNTDFYLWRFNSNGSRDDTFVPGYGYARQSFGGTEAVHAVALDEVGRMIMVGSTLLYDGIRRVAVARYSPDGYLDPSFDQDGLAQFIVGDSAQARDVLVAPGGTLVLVGDTVTGGGQTDSLIMRLLPDGSLDTSFNGTGILVTDLGGADSIAAAVLDAQERLQVTGSSSTPTSYSDLMTARFTATWPDAQEPPVVVNVAFQTPEEVTLTGSVTGVDADGDALTFEAVTMPTRGILTFHADGSFTYVPDFDYAGPDSFTYRARDGQHPSNIATVNLKVLQVNDAPVAQDDAFTLLHSRTFDSGGGALLLNDSDIDSNFLTVRKISDTQHGSLTLYSNGRVVYRPHLYYAGQDSFQYEVTDGYLTSEVVTVTLNVVNTPPKAGNFALSVSEDSYRHTDLIGSDADGDAITYRIVDGPDNGTASFGYNYLMLYKPALNFYGTDTITYVTNDGVTDSAPATLTFTVIPVDDAPSARADRYNVVHNHVLTVDAPGVLANDDDVEGDVLSVELRQLPANGTVEFNVDGSFIYTPNGNFAGEDRFTYRLFDGVRYGLQDATVYISVTNTAPTAEDLSLVTQEDVVLRGVLPGSDAEGDPLSFSLGSSARHGWIEISPNGEFLYIPTTEFSGTDTFTYFISDGYSQSDPVTVNMTVMTVNDPPSVGADLYKIRLNSVLSLPAPGVLANDRDAEGATLTAELVSAPRHGTLTFQSDGSFTYVPQLSHLGFDSFKYRVTDGNSWSESFVSIQTVQFSAPSSLTATVSGSSVTLNWVDNGGGFTDGFHIERAAKPKGNKAPSFSRIATVAATPTSFTQSVSSGTWYYRVVAFDGTYLSPYSSTVQASVGGTTGGGGKPGKTKTQLSSYSTSYSLEQDASTTTTAKKNQSGGTYSNGTLDLFSLVKAQGKVKLPGR